MVSVIEARVLSVVCHSCAETLQAKGKAAEVGIGFPAYACRDNAEYALYCRGSGVLFGYVFVSRGVPPRLLLF